jgi:hypothetical protein
MGRGVFENQKAMIASQKLMSITAGARLAPWILLAICFLSCNSDSQSETPSVQTAETADSGFTFFDLGKDTRYTADLRRSLEDRLGNDAIERRSIINLEPNYKGFLQEYFPVYHQLNRQLNDPPGERVEHNTIKLMYRYAQRKEVPFDYVELVFSDYNQKPLLFRIHFQKDVANIIPSLKTKYGEPQVIEWSQGNGRSLYWMQNKDLMIASAVPDQFGNPEFRILIYFYENIDRLIQVELAEKEREAQQRIQSGRQAF